MKTKLFVFLIFVSYAVSAQKWKAMMYDNRYNFYEVVKEAENYFKTHDKNAKGSGYKEFMRWVYANEYKYYPSGDRSHEDPLLLKHAYENFLASSNAARPFNSSSVWEELGPRDIDSITGHYSIGLGRVIDVKTVTQDTIFLSSEAGGLWKSTDGGQTWSPKSDGLIASGADAIAFSPFNHNKMYMDVQNPSNNYSYGIYRSDDGGETWYESNFNPTNVGFGGLGDDFKIFFIEPHPTIDSVIIIGTNRGVYISEDDLQTWTRVYTIFDSPHYAEITTIAFHPTDPNTFYIMDNEWWNADRSKIYITHDLGQTWTTSAQIVDNNNNPNNALGRLDVSPQCPDCVFLATGEGLWKSTDRGHNFTYVANPNMSFVGFAVNKSDMNNMIYGYVDIMVTQDEGQTWQQSTHWSLDDCNGTGNTYLEKLHTATDYVHADLHPAKYENGHFYIGTDGFMCKSPDGINWEIISYGTGIRENYRLGVGQNNMDAVIVGSQDNGNSFHTDHGWVEITGGDGMEGIVHPLNEKAFIGSYQYGSRFRTFDEDVTRVSVTPPVGDNAYWTAPLAYDPNDQMTIYDFRLGVWKSTDFGTTWTQLSSNLFGTGYWDAIYVAEIARNDSRIMYVSNRGSLKKSVDGGVNFTDISGLPDLHIRDIAIDPQDDNTVLVVYGDYNHPADKIYMSTDGGNSWQNITYNLNNIPAHSVVVDNTPEHRIYVGTELGVFYKSFNDTAWQVLGTGLPKVSVFEMEIHEASNYLYITSWGRGLWRIKLPGRENYPEIQKVSITSPPTPERPKEGVLQYVTSVINYNGTLSSVEVKYSVNNRNLDQTISMSASGNQWVSDTHLPDVTAGDKVYFKITATGSNNDTTESFIYMYEVKPFEYCGASGGLSGGAQLEFTEVKIFDENNQLVLDNTTGYADYTFFNNNVINLEAGKTYTIQLSGSPAWHENDYAGWIDYNHDGEFTGDEKIIYEVDADGTASAQFTVPVDKVFNTNLRMRLRLANYGTQPSPCGENIFGEVEDYLVKIVDTTPPVPDIPNLPDIVSECEITSLTPPTATDLVAGTVQGTPDVTLPINTPGTTVVTWTYDDGNGNTSSQTQNVIYTPIDSTVTRAGDTLTANASGSNYTYQWGDCSNNTFVPIAGETGRSFVPAQNGSYAVEISNGECSVVSECIDFTLLKITGTNLPEGIKIYPNPSGGIFTVEINHPENGTYLKLTGISGKTLFVIPLHSGKNIIDIRKFSKGIYMLQLLQNGRISNFKIIKN
jgi:photosystem II stability/assembly factor-like uncharacterized protein